MLCWKEVSIFKATLYLFFMFAKFLIDSLILYVLDALPLEKQSILISLQSEAIKKRSLMEKKALESKYLSFIPWIYLRVQSFKNYHFIILGYLIPETNQNGQYF
jgi:hypothetical protein